MKAPRSSVLILPTMLMLLGGCAAEPAVDAEAAREWLQSLESAESDGPGAAGILSVSVGEEPQSAAVRFDSPRAITRVDVRCYGNGDVSATLSVSLSGVTGGPLTKDQEITCDQEAHAIDLGGAVAAGVTVEGTATAQTYAHLTVIQQLTVER